MSDDMLDFENIDENDDVLREAIKSYKEAMRRHDQDLDVEFFLKTLRSVNESSVIKVARNPVDKNHEWVPGTKLFNVGKPHVDDEHHLTLRIKHDSSAFTVEDMLEQFSKLKKKLHGMHGPVMLAISDEKKVCITDIYSHAFVKDMWAGLPFDVVLGYFEKDVETESESESE